MQRWTVVQYELLLEIRGETGSLTPRLEKLIHTLDWVRVEEFVESTWCGVGRPPHERAWLANAFVAKAVLGRTTTTGLIERLAMDRALRRICGFAPCKKLPSEATFSRAFEEFAQGRLAERVHESLVKEHLGEELIGHIRLQDELEWLQAASGHGGLRRADCRAPLLGLDARQPRRHSLVAEERPTGHQPL
jgi:hypothetical protein